MISPFDLPIELFLEVISYLGLPERLALMRTCQAGYIICTDELYKAGAKRRMGVLRWAAERGQMATMKLAMRNGHDINDFMDHDTSDRDFTVFSPGLFHFRPRSSPWRNWSQNETPPQTPLHAAVSFGDPRAIRYLLNHGAGRWPSHEDKPVLPLHSAIARDRVSAAGLLIDRGADATRCNHSDGVTLICATYFCSEPMVSLLLDKGAEIDAPNERGWTPLLCAYKIWIRCFESQRASWHGQLKVEVENARQVWYCLLDRGARADIPNIGEDLPYYINGSVFRHLFWPPPTTRPDDEKD